MSVCTCSNPTPAGLLAPDHCGAAAWPLVIERQRLPRLGLSALNSMAFGLAVYASQCGLLQHHARLASSCWSSSTGRDFYPQGSDERFQSCNLHLIPLSQTSWRNRCNRRALDNELPRPLTACFSPLTSSGLADRCDLAWGRWGRPPRASELGSDASGRVALRSAATAPSEAVPTAIPGEASLISSPWSLQYDEDFLDGGLALSQSRG